MPELKFLHGNDISTANVPISAGTFYLDLEKNELWYDDPSGQNTTNHIRLFDDIYKQLEDLQYEQITISKFTCTNVPEKLQKGCIISGTLKFDWKTSKVPTKLLVNNTQASENIVASQGTISIPNQTFQTGTEYILAAEDERTIDGIHYPELNAATKSFKFQFLTPVLYGSFPADQTINSELLNNTNTISYTLRNSATGEYTMDCGEVADNRVSIFACPASWSVHMTYGGQEQDWPVMELEYSPKQFIANNELITYEAKSTLYKVYYGTNIGLKTITIKVN